MRRRQRLGCFGRILKRLATTDRRAPAGDMTGVLNCPCQGIYLSNCSGLPTADHLKFLGIPDTNEVIRMTNTKAGICGHCSHEGWVRIEIPLCTVLAPVTPALRGDGGPGPSGLYHAPAVVRYLGRPAHRRTHGRPADLAASTSATAEAPTATVYCARLRAPVKRRSGRAVAGPPRSLPAESGRVRARPARIQQPATRFESPGCGTLQHCGRRC